MSLMLIILVVWVGVMVVSLAVMSAFGAHARRADENGDGFLAAATSVAMPGVDMGTDVSVGLRARPVLQACRDCLSVISGGHETCPACGGTLAATRSLDGDRTPASVSANTLDAERAPGSQASAR